MSLLDVVKESSTYKAILDEGRLEEVRKMLLLLGRVRFGEPSAKIVALLDAVTDLSRLEALVVRLLHVKSWEELLAVNGAARPRGRKKA